MNLRPVVWAIVSSFLANVEQASANAITLAAKPASISIDSARTAVIVVDMQNDFAAKGGMFDRAGIDISGAQKVIAPTAKVLAEARQEGISKWALTQTFRIWGHRIQ